MRSTYFYPMRFICVYCHRILDKSNFAGFIRDSDNKGAEYHAWRHLTPKEEEIEAKAEMLLQLWQIANANQIQGLIQYTSAGDLSVHKVVQSPNPNIS